MVLPVSLRKSFTLVELIIVVAIIIVITGAIVPSFNTYIKNQNVKQAQEFLRNELRNVQNKAINGTLSTSLIGGNQIKYWGMRLFADRLEVFTAATLNQTACNDYASNSQGSVNLPAGMSISSPPSDNNPCIFFSMTDGSISTSRTGCTISNTSCFASVTATDGTRSRSVSINGAGLIF